MSNLEFNPYKLLGVDIEAPLEVIKAAYKALMKSGNIHPDLGGLNHLAQEINEAYQILSDAKKRREIDLQLSSATKIQEAKDPEYYVICLNCQSSNRIKNPKFIMQSRCYHCNLLFSGEGLNNKEQSNKNKPRFFYNNTDSSTTKNTKQKEKIDEDLANELYNRRMYFRAINEYKSLVSSHPKEPYYTFMIGKCYYNLQYYRDSLTSFLKTLDRNKDYVEARIFAGKSLMQMAQYSEAMIHFKAAVKFPERVEQAKANIGICYYQMGLFPKAIEFLISVVEKDPLVEQSAYFLALAFYQVRDFKNAKKFFTMAKFHYPSNMKISEMIDYCNRNLVNN